MLSEMSQRQCHMISLLCGIKEKKPTQKPDSRRTDRWSPDGRGHQRGRGIRSLATWCPRGRAQGPDSEEEEEAARTPRHRLGAHWAPVSRNKYEDMRTAGGELAATDTRRRPCLQSGPRARAPPACWRDPADRRAESRAPRAGRAWGVLLTPKMPSPVLRRFHCSGSHSRPISPGTPL